MRQPAGKASIFMLLRSPVLALAAALVLTPATTASASEPMPLGELVYVHHDGQQYDVWTVNGDGTGRQPLVSSSGLEHMPELSPDGRLLAFEGRYTEVGSDASVYVQDVGTGARTRVAASEGFLEGPTDWYVDAAGVQHLVFVRARDAAGTLYDAWETVPGSGVERQLTDLGGSVMAVRVQGGTLVFQHGPVHGSADSDICTASLGDRVTQKTCLTSGTATDMFPTVAPNGDVVFARTASGRHKLVRWTRSTGRISSISTPSALKGVGYPALSPDGSTLAFAGSTSTNLGTYDIWVMPAAGGKAKNVTPVSGADYVPSWRP